MYEWIPRDLCTSRLVSSVISGLVSLGRAVGRAVGRTHWPGGREAIRKWSWNSEVRAVIVTIDLCLIPVECLHRFVL